MSVRVNNGLDVFVRVNTGPGLDISEFLNKSLCMTVQIHNSLTARLTPILPLTLKNIKSMCKNNQKHVEFKFKTDVSLTNTLN